jgi:hypothetical protein
MDALYSEYKKIKSDISRKKNSELRNNTSETNDVSVSEVK